MRADDTQHVLDVVEFSVSSTRSSADSLGVARSVWLGRALLWTGFSRWSCGAVIEQSLSVWIRSGCWGSVWTPGGWGSSRWSSGCWSSVWTPGGWGSSRWRSGHWSSGRWSSGRWRSGRWSSGRCSGRRSRWGVGWDVVSWSVSCWVRAGSACLVGPV